MSRARGGSGRQRTARAGGGRRWGLIIGVAAVVAILAGFTALVVVDVSQRAAQKPPEGVESFEIESREHIEGDISYEQTPPVGGKHNPIWQNCGFYSEPIRNENAVHSLEHGAVWITYRPDLPQQQVDRLREVASDNDFVLVSPYSDLPSPVVASAWGKQLKLDSTEDPRLERFVSAYQRGPQTPEPGAPCTGGVGEPEV